MRSLGLRADASALPASVPVGCPGAIPIPHPYPCQTVYLTRTGKRYHRENCRHLASSKIPISLKEAKQNGYTPWQAQALAWLNHRADVVFEMRRGSGLTEPAASHAVRL